jgi:hypothetical protein
MPGISLIHHVLGREACPERAEAPASRGGHRRSRKSRMAVRVTFNPSARSRARFSSRLPPKPPNRPAAATTRWAGTSRLLQLRMMLPTAREARGLPAAAATSPYVATRPTGMRRTTDRTRLVKDFIVLGSWFLVLGSWFFVLGSSFLVLRSSFLYTPRIRQQERGQRRTVNGKRRTPKNQELRTKNDLEPNPNSPACLQSAGPHQDPAIVLRLQIHGSADEPNDAAEADVAAEHPSQVGSRVESCH